MPQAIVHIGTPKSGTSAIQKFLFSYADQLTDLGFTVLRQWPRNHSPLSVLSGPVDRWDEASSLQSRRLGCGSQRPSRLRWAEVRTTLLNELRKFVVESQGRTMLFSCEGLYTRLDSSDIMRFRSLMDQFGVNVTILVYLREPLSFRISQMGQFIKMGWHVNLMNAMRPEEQLTGLPRPSWPGATAFDAVPFEMYSERLSAWERVFPGKVQVRLFDSVAHSGGVVDDFCAAVGIPQIPGLPTTERVNEALSWPLLKALNEVNCLIDRRALLPNGDFNTQRRLAAWNLPPEHNLERFHPGLERARLFDAFFAAPNETLRAKYFPERAILWESPTHTSLEAEASDLELSEADHIRIRQLLGWARAETLTNGGRRSLPRRLHGVFVRGRGLVGRRPGRREPL